MLAWIAREEIPFVMEVTDRTEADRKGGHIAKRPEGGYLLRETAQTPEEDLDALQDISRHRYVNTNNLWVDLRGAQGAAGRARRRARAAADRQQEDRRPRRQVLAGGVPARDGDGRRRRRRSTGARPLRVPRSRFSPVKSTEDLLALRSDAYVLTDDARVELDPRREHRPPVIDLDDEHYKRLADFEQRFPKGAPSLVECERLSLEGDVTFGRDVVVRGTVRVEGPKEIPDGEELEG